MSVIQVGEAARRLGLSPPRVRALCAEGKIRATRFGRGKWLIPEEEVLRVEEGRPAPDPEASGGR